ncbi:hypothetical protein N825_33200 [Skermanella stibiiresistens SB22]|uniref:Uncharacterized protein n=1 Tax=Skermanella stibiiresistens SB22 TaxID=1385369 RepID=W9HAA4_9PROT|nr:hypothetical protein N825_33200 [Skermanella stibiiresistens SB22]
MVEAGTLATWNPSGYSLIGWLMVDDGWSLAVKIAVLVLAVVVAGWGVLTTLAALGRGGVAVALAIVAVLTWMVGEAAPADDRMMVLSWWLPFSVGLLATGGIAWASFVTRLTGQSQKRYISGYKSR